MAKESSLGTIACVAAAGGKCSKDGGIERAAPRGKEGVGVIVGLLQNTIFPSGPKTMAGGA